MARSVSICPPATRMLVVCQYDSEPASSSVFDVLALRSYVDADGEVVTEPLIYIDGDRLESPHEHWHKYRSSFAWQVVVCPWPRDEDQEKLAR